MRSRTSWALACGTAGPPHDDRSAACTVACGWPVLRAQAPTSCAAPCAAPRPRGGSPPARRGASPAAAATRCGRCCWSACRCRSSVDTWSGSSRPGQPEEVLLLLGCRPRRPCRTRRRRTARGRTSPAPRAPRSARCVRAELVGAVALAVRRGEQPVVQADVDALAPRASSAGPARGRARAPACAASASSCGTLGRNTDAVSPRRRARTNRPTACAKNSGVDVLRRVDADRQPRHVDALRDHPDGDHPALSRPRRTRRSGRYAPSSSDSTTTGDFAGDPREAARRTRGRPSGRWR